MASEYLANVKFLVVDDNAFMRLLIREVLKAFGAREIAEASNGIEGYQVARQMTPDIALVDWEMTPENGLAFVRKIRTNGDSPNPFMPIIMVSGYSEQRRVLAARDAGVNEFVVKPLSAASLFSRVQLIIERPRTYVRTGSYFGPDRRRRNQHVIGKDRRGEGSSVMIAPEKTEKGETVYIDVDDKAKAADAD